MNTAPLQEFANGHATYNAEDAEYTVDTGIFIECPSCGSGTTLAYALETGCFHCHRDAWTVSFE
jgi:uncharacterized protein (DUF983 family)